MVPAQKGGYTPSAKAARVPSAAGVTGSGSKKFDFNLYITAVGNCIEDMLNVKIPYFFKNMGPVFKAAPAWWKKQGQDEQISYVVLGFGPVIAIVGVVLFFVL